MATRDGLSRLITFADAVVAISITLLVLPLVDIASQGEPDGTLYDLLNDHQTQIYSFLLGFVVIIHMWRGHHRLVEHVAGYDRMFVNCTIVWMFTIVLVPFVTETTAVYGDETLAKGLYIGVILAGSACVSLSTIHVQRTPALQIEGGDDHVISPVLSVVSTLLLLAALLCALVIPGVDYYALLLLFLSSPLTHWWQRRHP